MTSAEAKLHIQKCLQVCNVQADQFSRNVIVCRVDHMHMFQSVCFGGKLVRQQQNTAEETHHSPCSNLSTFEGDFKSLKVS
jgi:hypothetical protein